MENSEMDATTGPWRACARPAPFPSREHMLLSEALAMVVDAEHYIASARMVEARTTATPDWLDRSDRLDVEGVIRKLHGSILREELQTFVRPLGGGQPRRLSTDAWEMDDPHLRFAWSTIDPSDPFAADAVPTHWILVLRREAELAAGRKPPAPELARQGPTAVAGTSNTVPPAARTAAAPTTSVVTAPAETGTPASGLIKRSEVLRLTGFSKSTLYDKIAGKTFPAQVLLGSRMSRWYESEVNEWLRNPR